MFESGISFPSNSKAWYVIIRNFPDHMANNFKDNYIISLVGTMIPDLIISVLCNVGYNFQSDIRQLSHSYGDLECFRSYEMLLDIQKLFKEPHGGLSGVAKVLRIQ